MTNWDEALDVFERRLAGQRQALAAGHAGDLPPFAPDESLGELPRHLLERAARLLQEAHELEAQLELAVATAGRESAVVRRLLADHARIGTARFVDHAV